MFERMFTTRMSMDKKKLQNRFLKIRTKSGKASKIAALFIFSFLIILIIGISIGIAVSKLKNDISDNAGIKLAVNGVLIEFENEPYVLSERRSGGYSRQIMAYFPLEELAEKIDYLTEIKTEDNKITVILPQANDKYELEINKKEIFYNPLSGINSGRREIVFAPVKKGDTIYIPYEYIEYIWKDANNYAVSGSLLYENEELNISFEIPAYWLNKYYIDETAVDKGYIVVMHKGIAEKYDVSGKLFAIRKKSDEEIGKILNSIENQTVLWQNEKYGYILGRPTDIKPPLLSETDKEDIEFYFEYERMRKDISLVESTFSLIKKESEPVITNAENMSYAGIKDLQRQVDNGYFPWRTDHLLVIQAYISGKGFDIEKSSLVSFFGDGEKGSGTCLTENGYYSIEIFKPLDKTEKGIWLVKNFQKLNPVEIESAVFYNLDPKDNRLGAECKKQSDGWYKLNKEAVVHIYAVNGIPEAELLSVTAHFTPTGTDTAKYEKQIGYSEPPFAEIPFPVNLKFSKEDSMGHLQFVFNYKGGATFKSDYYNIIIND